MRIDGDIAKGDSSAVEFEGLEVYSTRFRIEIGTI